MKYILFVILLLLSVEVNATVYRYDLGLSVSNGSLSVEDPDGPTKNTNVSSISPVAVFITGKTSRIFTNLNYHSFNLGYSGTDIGQNVQTIGLDVSYQHFFIQRPVVYFSIGGGLSNSSFRNRVTEDDGYLKVRYEDRNSNTASIIVGGGITLFSNKENAIGINTTYRIAVDNGEMGMSFDLHWLFKGSPNIR